MKVKPRRAKPAPPLPGSSKLLGALGCKVRALRAARGLTRRELAARSGLSERFLARIESGSGNISLLRFAALARALDISASELLQEASRPAGSFIALLGLRGAGKSTIGAALAKRLRLPFFELDSLIEEEAGLSLSQIFEMHGERYYRRLEKEALVRLLASAEAGVLAAGWGIVTDPQTHELLRRSCLTVWLRARPEDHWSRVVAQRDRRPMAGKPNAMEELRALLSEREPLYAGAELTIDTSSTSIQGTVDRIQAALKSPPAPATRHSGR